MSPFPIAKNTRSLYFNGFKGGLKQLGFWQDPANSFVLLLKCTFEELFEEKCLSILKAEDLLHEQGRTRNVAQYHTH